MKKIFIFAICLAFATSGFSQLLQQRQSLIQPIQWFSFEDALLLNAERAAYGLPTKKIFIDVYTDWCGFCKRMDVTTFSHPVIADMLNTYWIPVKLNAERTDTITINDQKFVNENPCGRNCPHQLAIVLLNGTMGYPSIVLIDETGRPIQTLPGYKTAPQLEMLLVYFSSNAYRTVEWEEFQNTFQGIIRE
jgi:thioredoxin-related protein